MSLRVVKTDGTELIIICESSEYQIDLRRLQVKLKNGETMEIPNVVSVR